MVMVSRTELAMALGPQPSPNLVKAIGAIRGRSGRNPLNRKPFVNRKETGESS
jgi:hypothetical protein